MSLLLAAALAGSAWCAPPRQLLPIGRDAFQDGLANWRLEAEDPRAIVSARDGVLDIATPAGLSLWWKAALHGDYAIRFTAEALPAPATAGPHAGRWSDLNMFWNASEADGAPPRVRSGRFSDYDDLRAYYVGFGANGNRSTRLRAYDGERRLLAGFADAALAEPGEAPMRDSTRLQPGQPLAIEIVSTATPPQLRWQVNGQTLFTHRDPTPRLQGHFALRTTASRLQIRHFEILHCR